MAAAFTRAKFPVANQEELFSLYFRTFPTLTGETCPCERLAGSGWSCLMRVVIRSHGAKYFCVDSVHVKIAKIVADCAL